jgi:hypothetical protein
MGVRLSNERAYAAHALSFVASLPVANPKLAILDACCSGTLTAHGRIYHSTLNEREYAIPVDLWRELCRVAKLREEAWSDGSDVSAAEYQADWLDGSFEIFWPTEEGPEILRITNVWFSRRELEREFSNRKEREGSNSATAPESESRLAERKNKGGRPPLPHGDTIAAVALRLSILPPTELGRCTTDSVSAELLSEYQRRGAVPNVQSIKKYAQGILRALRANNDVSA